MKSHDKQKEASPTGRANTRDTKDAFNDQRNPPPERGSQPRHWQGGGAGQQGSLVDQPAQIDERAPGRGNQSGRAGDYGRAHEEMRNREQAAVDDERGVGSSPKQDEASSDDFGRGNERTRDEGHSGRGFPKEG
ncbi:MAG TPA: hypothetical protein VL001_01005 [Candidimonas sp.]|nr:hypothetical protein [Candidimonas sp.]